MSAINLLETASKLEFPPAKSFKDLEKGEYKVKEFRLIKTKYGNRLTVHFEDFFVWLPPRFSAVITKFEQVDELNVKAMKSNYFMQFNGKDENRKGYLIISFHTEE